METSAAAAPPMPTPEAAEEMQALAEAAEVRAAEHADEVLAAETADFTERNLIEPERERESEPEPEQRELTQRSEPTEPAELREPAPLSAAAARLGPDGLSRLRSRYVDLKARLAEKTDLEPDAKAELDDALERLNPDAWHSSDEVTLALEQYESAFERLRSVVGRHARRRL